MARRRTRKNPDAANAEAREALVLGKPPRLLPRRNEDSIKAAMELTARLRPAALPGSKPVTVEQMPEIMLVLTCHPELWERVALVSIQLLGNGALDRRDAELAILRTAWVCQAPYEWGEHVGQGKTAGLTAEEIERIILGSSAPGWDEMDRAILRTVEELHADAMVSDATWNTLKQRFDDKQMFELLVLIGQFTNVAYFQNALRLPLTKGSLGLSAR